MLKTTSRIAGIFMAAVICPVTMAAVIFENTFESSTEGWSAITTAVGNPSTPVSFASLGNPGGALKHVAPSDNLVSYFISPSSAAIALHSAVGGSVSWEISTAKGGAGDTFFSGADVVVRGTGQHVRKRLASSITLLPVFHTFSTAFSASDGWEYTSDNVTWAAATQSQINGVLLGAVRLAFRAEYWSSVNPDTTYLDNVRILSSVPDPASLPLFAIGLVVLAVTRWRSAR